MYHVDYKNILFFPVGREKQAPDSGLPLFQKCVLFNIWTLFSDPCVWIPSLVKLAFIPFDLSSISVFLITFFLCLCHLSFGILIRLSFMSPVLLKKILMYYIVLSFHIFFISMMFVLLTLIFWWSLPAHTPHLSYFLCNFISLLTKIFFSYSFPPSLISWECREVFIYFFPVSCGNSSDICSDVYIFQCFPLLFKRIIQVVNFTCYGIPLPVLLIGKSFGHIESNP